MASMSIPGQPRRWGNESTNFCQASKGAVPGAPSRDSVYDVQKTSTPTLVTTMLAPKPSTSEYNSQPLLQIN